TTVANILFNSYISDLETCFKLMPLALLRELDVRSRGFGLEPEVTGKLLARGYRPFEIPISYRARDRAAGKKITWKDGIEARWIRGRTRLAARACPGPGRRASSRAPDRPPPTPPERSIRRPATRPDPPTAPRTTRPNPPTAPRTTRPDPPTAPRTTR